VIDQAKIKAARERAIAARDEYRYGASAEGWLTPAQGRAAKRCAIVLTALYERVLRQQLDAECAERGVANPVDRGVRLSGWGPLYVAEFPTYRIIPCLSG
jgi:hypothetical protein